MISIKLLREVLKDYSICTGGYLQEEPNLIFYGGTCDTTDCINIYELAGLCKKWAKKLNFIYMHKGKKLSETSSGIEVRVTVKQLYNNWYGVDLITLDERFLKISCLNHKTFSTENEAVFQACEWILEHK